MSDDKLVKRDGDVQLVLARDLESAQPGTFVHIDRHGQTRSPARYRIIAGAVYGAMAAMLVASTVLYTQLLGAPGLLLGVGLTGLFARGIARGRRLRRAAVLLMQNRLDEAEAVLESVARSRWKPRAVRASLAHNLAGLATRRGDNQMALAQLQEALRLYPRRSVYRPMVEHSIIHALVRLGEVVQARRCFSAMPMHDGDFFKLQHYTAELHLCFAEGSHGLDGDGLHDRARVALSVNTAGMLLALVSWAHWRVGDADQAWHLLREAYDRRGKEPIDRFMPAVFAWMEAHREEAGVEVSKSPD